MDLQTTDVLRGLMPRSKWATAAGKCDATAKRWQDAGKIVVVYIGREPYVDIEKTVARLRGEDRARARKSRAAA